MEEKQIMIDGVDVNKCKHIQVAYPKNEKEYFVFCKAFYLENEDDFCDCTEEPNCYYKQLKRKEQECEQLKEVLNGTNP